ncbi:MAG: D-alanyl-D-alanine carboxypeptidase [Lachnospiraceae bacterium]|nr:D-alanyl-D-alanine carboxypeptidase [Lachnospiraceae bacterium]
MTVLFVMTCAMTVSAQEEAAPAPVSVEAPSYVLMEASTGKIICAKNENERLHPASITKIMTLLLIFDALDSGKIRLDDPVTTSAHAKSMGGSQVFLEEGEVQSVDTLIKCIAVASGNDAAVAMAEYIAGSEESFVEMMNEKAGELGMTQTSFTDCCGLSDSDEHMTCAVDVAIMSRELINRYPAIYDYTKIWMEDITHETNKGSSTFTLSSTNKLLKQYPYATGLKTGSTSTAKYCLSATAQKDGVDLIAVVMKAPDHKVRFRDAMTLLNYGFGLVRIYVDENKEPLNAVSVKGGVEEQTPVEYKGEFRYLDVTGADFGNVTKKLEMADGVEAPVKKGDKVGEAVYFLGEERIGCVDIVCAKDVREAVYKDYVHKLLFRLCV